MKVIIEHTSNFSARLIQFWMGVDALLHGEKPTFTYNHALIEHNGIVWEAISPEVVRHTMISHLGHKKYKKPYKTLEFELDLTHAQITKAIFYLNRQVGKKYETINFLWHPIKSFVGWMGSKNDGKHYCYELAIRTMNYTGRYNLDVFANPREFLNKMKEV